MISALSFKFCDCEKEFTSYTMTTIEKIRLKKRELTHTETVASTVTFVPFQVCRQLLVMLF